MALREGLGSRSTSSSLRLEEDSAGRRTNFSSFSSSFDEFGPPYADLPMEILVKIFTYLTPSDRREASQTCRRWCEASHHTAFLENFWLVLHRQPFDANGPPVRDLLQSFRHFPNVHLSEVDFERIGNFFTHFGPHIRRIVLRACEIQERDLTAILRRLPALRALTIESCRDLFMCVRLFEDAAEREELRQTLSNVTDLSLTHNQYLSDAILHRMVEIMPSLRALALAGCHISFHKGLYRKFYPGDGKQPSESVLTFHYVSQLIEQRKGSLRALDFGETLVDDNALEVLAGMSPALCLERLELNRCEQLSSRGLGTLITAQAAHLQHLNLSKTFRLTDSCLLQICRELRGLRVLKMRECRALSNQGVRELVQLPALEVLDISYCEDVNGAGLLEGIASRPNETLRELRVRALNLCERSIIAISEQLSALRILDLGYCFHAVSDLCVQFIFRNLVRLTELDLESCRKLSDEGLTGLGMLPIIQRHEQQQQQQQQTTAQSGASLGNGSVEGNAAPADDQARPASPEPEPALQAATAHMRISLRSRAEREIVEDAERKKQLLEAMQRKDNLQSARDDGTTFSGYSIGRLQQLRVLNLTGCNRLTDVTLLCNFKLLELRDLYLAQCQQISVDGIRALVRGCPAVERLDLSECHSINDRAVEQIAFHLHRLRTLSLRRCYQLTDFSLDYIACHARRLRELDVRGCKHMCADPAMRLVNLPLLATILPGKQDENGANGVFGAGSSASSPSLPPAPPPPAAPSRASMRI
ncbi:F-box and leucine-rich repeat protein 13-like [Anopheles gambiae]|uniref:F-box and leucine-rich repeat protein 13-like n=1 Tax=Anopheles gambiae TaxID=7165 RepID=UPI002AC9C78B|nr:F-box and leucine-rich repeat protein 13-like [Anopheles gambiae]